MRYSSIRALALLSACAIFALTLTPNRAWAFTDCRTLDTVIASADPATNAGMHGHLAKHVVNMDYQLLSNPQIVGTRAYPDTDTFTEVWDAYALLPYDRAGRPNCDGSVGSPRGQIPFARLVDVDGFNVSVCADAADGACLDWNVGAATGNVTFSFTRNGDGAWILNTSYPYP